MLTVWLLWKIYLIEMLQSGLVIGSTTEGCSFELNTVNILLLWLHELNASMKAIGCFSQRVAEASSTLCITCLSAGQANF